MILVLAPLTLAALLTIATTVVIGLPINFANIIALPLLFGIGVAFDIYFVTNWRAGLSAPLASATTRAVLFSALTTTTAFGSLALSPHPGTSGMGLLLTIALFHAAIHALVLAGVARQHPAGNAPPSPAFDRPHSSSASRYADPGRAAPAPMPAPYRGRARAADRTA